MIFHVNDECVCVVFGTTVQHFIRPFTHTHTHTTVTIWRAEVKQKQVLELNERIYHTLAPCLAPVNKNWINITSNLESERSKFSHPYYTTREKGGWEQLDVHAWDSGPKLMEFRRRKSSGSVKFVFEIIHTFQHFVRLATIFITLQI